MIDANVLSEKLKLLAERIAKVPDLERFATELSAWVSRQTGNAG